MPILSFISSASYPAPIQSNLQSFPSGSPVLGNDAWEVETQEEYKEYCMNGGMLFNESEIYSSMPETKAIIHTHGRKLTYNPAIQKHTSAEYLRYGRFGELNKILKILKENNGFGIMKLHGEICAGNDLYDASQKLKGRIEEVK